MVVFTSVPYQEKMSRQLGSGRLGTALKAGKAAIKAVGKAGKKGANAIKSTAKKGKGKFDKKLPPGSMKRKVAMVGLGLGAEYAAQKAITKFLGGDNESADGSSNQGYFARHAPSAEKRRKIYDGGLSLMESELNRRRGRTDATSEKLERLHKYFAKRRKGRREELYRGRPARLAGGKRKGRGKNKKKASKKKKKKAKRPKKKKAKKRKVPAKRKKKKAGKRVARGNRGMNLDAAASQWRNVRKVFKI